jgi:hypothetical protein
VLKLRHGQHIPRPRVDIGTVEHPRLHPGTLFRQRETMRVDQTLTRPKRLVQPRIRDSRPPLALPQRHPRSRSVQHVITDRRHPPIRARHPTIRHRTNIADRAPAAIYLRDLRPLRVRHRRPLTETRRFSHRAPKSERPHGQFCRPTLRHHETSAVVSANHRHRPRLATRRTQL